MTVAKRVEHRQIAEVLHFTTNRGLVGILGSGTLQSRRRLPEDRYLQHVAFANANVRPEESAWFDKTQDWLDYVNLSISEINAHFFAVSEKWHLEHDVWWVICAFDVEILSHDGVYFATTNNKYQYCVRSSGVPGLEGLFAPTVRRLPGWQAQRRGRADHLPTCQQAEVLYPSEVPLEYLRKIYVRTGEDSDVVRGWLREFQRTDVSVVIEPQKFAGAPN